MCLLVCSDVLPIVRHADFRLFACMNPATDVGKKDLPLGIRNRYSSLQLFLCRGHCLSFVLNCIFLPFKLGNCTLWYVSAVLQWLCVWVTLVNSYIYYIFMAAEQKSLSDLCFRFTELFVDELEDSGDLRLLVKTYLQSLSGVPIGGIVEFYQNVRQRASKSLADGTGRRPHFRFLC